MTDAACPLLLARSSCGMTDRPSSRLYTAVTKYWPRIAAGLVALVAGADLVIGGLTSDTSVEFYVPSLVDAPVSRPVPSVSMVSRIRF